jgi:hypothetical protein
MKVPQIPAPRSYTQCQLRNKQCTSRLHHSVASYELELDRCFCRLHAWKQIFTDPRIRFTS